MKNKILILIIAQMYVSYDNSFAQAWQWAQQFGSTSKDFSAIVQHKNNSIYAAGGFYGAAMLYDTSITNPCQGINDFFLTKMNNNGQVKWLKQMGGNNLCTNCYEGIGGLVIDSFENIYVTGGFYNNTSIGQFNLTGSQFDLFIAKFDSSGNCLWAISAGGVGKDASYGICIASNNDLFITGTNDDSITFANFTLPPGGFIAKYDDSGNFIFAKKIFETFHYLGKNLSCANPQDIKFVNNKLFISGSVLNDTIQSDTISIVLKNNSYNDFVSSYELNGNIDWLNTFAGPLPFTPGLSLGIDDFGNTFITGSFTDTGYFHSDTLFNNGFKDAYLVKFDINGNEKWVQHLHATGGSISNNVSTDSLGYSYITGKFSGNAQFGNIVLASNSISDFFVARFDSLGNCLGVKAFENGKGNGVTQDSYSNAIVAATFTTSTSLGSFPLNSYGNEDIIYAKLDAITGNMENKPPNNQLLIYANPTQGKCNITIPDEFANEQQLTLTVYDNIGREIQVQTITMHEGKIKLNLTAEAKGMYHVALSNGVKIYNGKIVFE